VLIRPGSDHQAAVGNQAHPWLANWTGTGIAVDQGTISQYCGGNIEPCADLTIEINGTTYGTVDDPCGATASVNVHDSNGNDVGSLVSGSWVVPNNVFLRFLFATGDDTSLTHIVDADSAGTYTAITDDGSSGTITVSINGGAFGAFSNPTTLVATNTIAVKRTTFSAAGWVKLTGTY
jgi:hypothetical protein